MHRSFAYYRLPYADRYTVVEAQGEPLILQSLEVIGGRAGFVIAPFMTTPHCPIVLIPAEGMTLRTEEFETGGQGERQRLSDAVASEASLQSYAEYAEAFGNFHSAVTQGQFRKLVLARRKAIRLTGGDDVERLFLRVCRLYPRLMVMLFSTPQTGMWIIATPEVLVQGQSQQWATMALAGTMPYAEGYAEWSEKNKGEQHVVEQYIENAIGCVGHDILKDGPYTMRAGNLQHLRTDFRFRMDEPIGRLVAQLHPTPAVCGLPKAEAQAFVVASEGMDRRYYSGFAGPVGINGESHLYVSLRCAQLCGDHAVLYAGGGIMPDSQCEQEWQETESKMETIKNVLE